MLRLANAEIVWKQLHMIDAGTSAKSAIRLKCQCHREKPGMIGQRRTICSPPHQELRFFKNHTRACQQPICTQHSPVTFSREEVDEARNFNESAP